MADGRDGFARSRKTLDERDCVRIDAQQVRIDLTAGQNERVIIVDERLRYLQIDRDINAPVVLVPSGDVLGADRGDIDLGPRGREALQRHFELGLLEAIGCHDENAAVG